MLQITDISHKENETDSEEQEKNKILVDREVYCCVSGLVEDCFKKEVLSYDDIENLYFSYEQAKDLNIIDDDFKKEDYEAGQQEIFEWYIISGWLAEKLKEQNEPILSYDDFNYFWGRTTTGQSIILDSVITNIRKTL
jgi:hypothetical protein